MSISLVKLNKEIGKNVFVVSLRSRTIRTSDYGNLEQVNESNNIALEKNNKSFSIIPFDEILKVYNHEGYIVYDAET